jgi:interleukin-1 receptor-associated kinase 1
VSTQVAYADIRKTKINLHKTMKLGKGRFGAVYRCTLPAAPSRMGQQSVEVVVKK